MLAAPSRSSVPWWRRRSPGAISLFANDLSAVISGIYCGIPAPVVVEENKFQSIIAVVHRSSVTANAFMEFKISLLKVSGIFLDPVRMVNATDFLKHDDTTTCQLVSKTALNIR